MYLTLEIEQAKKLRGIVLDKIHGGELSKEECGEYAVLYSMINSEIVFEESHKEETPFASDPDKVK